MRQVDVALSIYDSADADVEQPCLLCALCCMYVAESQCDCGLTLFHESCHVRECGWHSESSLPEPVVQRQTEIARIESTVSYDDPSAVEFMRSKVPPDVVFGRHGCQHS